MQYQTEQRQVLYTSSLQESLTEFARRGYKVNKVRNYSKTGKSVIYFQQPRQGN